MPALIGIAIPLGAGCHGASGAVDPCYGIRSPIQHDEEVIFFPTFAHPLGDSGEWEVRIHGWIFEPESHSFFRRAGLGWIRSILDIERGDAESLVLRSRARYFFADNERGEHVAIQLGDRCHTLAASDVYGHFKDTIRISAEEAERLQSAEGDCDGWVGFHAVTAQGDDRVFEGRVQFIDSWGLSIISDIDDTIRISQVTDPAVTLGNTFLREFEPVPGMAEAYRRWEATGARFHYVSASPWQLYPALVSLMEAEDFPAGSFHLRPVRFRSSSIPKMLGSAEALKLGYITTIIDAFPDRRFILIGDSTEKDPEIYATVARRYPAQILRILIRDVHYELDHARMEKAFEGLSHDLWIVFRSADEIDAVVP